MALVPLDKFSRSFKRRLNFAMRSSSSRNLKEGECPPPHSQSYYWNTGVRRGLRALSSIRKIFFRLRHFGAPGYLSRSSYAFTFILSMPDILSTSQKHLWVFTFFHASPKYLRAHDSFQSLTSKLPLVSDLFQILEISFDSPRILSQTSQKLIQISQMPF